MIDEELKEKTKILIQEMLDNPEEIYNVSKQENYRSSDDNEYIYFYYKKEKFTIYKRFGAGWARFYGKLEMFSDNDLCYDLFSILRKRLDDAETEKKNSEARSFLDRILRKK